MRQYDQPHIPRSLPSTFTIKLAVRRINLILLGASNSNRHSTPSELKDSRMRPNGHILRNSLRTLLIIIHQQSPDQFIAEPANPF
jgi:hypothetical protein